MMHSLEWACEIYGRQRDCCLHHQTGHYDSGDFLTFAPGRHYRVSRVSARTRVVRRSL